MSSSIIKSKKIILFFLFFLLFLFTNCSSEIISPEQKQIRELNEIEKRISASSSSFGFNLLREINKVEKDTNIFISPLSISMALGMTLNGAKGSTYEAMKNSLGLDGLSNDQINSSFQSLINLLINADEKVIFEIANSIWYKNSLTFEQYFIDINKKYFDALVTGLDFSNLSSVDIINNWVKENTNGKIDKIIEEINPETIMFLINAIYFKGTWTYKFEKSDTKDDIFYSPSGEVVCKMMAQENELNYFENEELQAVELPYGDNIYSMQIFLPKEGNNPDYLIENFISGYYTWSFTKQKGILYLPKFKTEYEKSLNDILKALGMGIAFDAYLADFTNLYSGNAFISEVKHKTFVEVDEEGTEAAAVTSVEIGRTSTGPSGFVMKVNKPFLFLIKEKSSGTILFMGKIINPN